MSAQRSTAGRITDDGSPPELELPVVGVACPEALCAFEWGLGRFHCTSKLGSGMASKVYRATCKRTGMEVALKCYVKRMLRPRIKQQVIGEISIHSRLNHPNILQFFAAFEDADHYWIVLELATKGDLYQEMVNIPVDEAVIARYVLLPLCSAVAYLHNSRLMHRDLKPENVVMAGDTVKLADFGFAVHQTRKRALSRVGTTDFMAPEMIMVPDRGRKVFRDQVPRDVREPYDESVDVWAVGVMAYELVTRNAPFTGKTEDLLIAAIQKGTYAIPPTLSRDFLDFLSRCLSLDPAQRSPARDLLRHPFLALHASERTVTRFRRAADALVDMDSALSQRTLDGVGVAEAASMRYKPPSGRSSAAGDANGGRSSVVSPTSSVVNRDALLQGGAGVARGRGGTVNMSESGNGPNVGKSERRKWELRRFLSDSGGGKIKEEGRGSGAGEVSLARRLFSRLTGWRVEKDTRQTDPADAANALAQLDISDASPSASPDERWRSPGATPAGIVVRHSVSGSPAGQSRQRPSPGGEQRGSVGRSRLSMNGRMSNARVSMEGDGRGGMRGGAWRDPVDGVVRERRTSLNGKRASVDGRGRKSLEAAVVVGDLRHGIRAKTTPSR